MLVSIFVLNVLVLVLGEGLVLGVLELVLEVTASEDFSSIKALNIYIHLTHITKKQIIHIHKLKEKEINK